MTEIPEKEVEVVGRYLEVDDAEEWDSAKAEVISETGQTPLKSTSSKEAEFRTENGRRYHAFEDRQYWLPNDDIEINRLDLQHSIWKLSFDGHLHLSPISGNVERVLDVGTGTGQWAIDFAKEHPTVQVLGTDLSPIQPDNVPSNCSFMVHNAESDWNFGSKFDFIQGRMLMMGIHDWPKFLEKAWDSLNPGGWLEVSNPEFPMCCDDESVAPDSPFMVWSQLIREAAGVDGIDTLVMQRYKSMVEQQGFVNIRSESLKWPYGPWPKGDKEKTIGQWMVVNVRAFISPSALGLFTKKLNWPKEDVEKLVEKALEDMEDRKKHYYTQM
jgi:SAM-dependent methyltransferase